jgi:hypothetical protein
LTQEIQGTRVVGRVRATNKNVVKILEPKIKKGSIARLKICHKADRENASTNWLIDQASAIPGPPHTPDSISEKLRIR